MISLNPLRSLPTYARVLTLTGAIICVLHLGAPSAHAMPIVFGGHIVCADPTACTVLVTFRYTDPGAPDAPPVVLPGIFVTPDAAGLFVAETDSTKATPPGSIFNDWFASVTVTCPCYEPKSEVFPLEPGGAGLKAIAGLAFEETLLHLIAEHAGAPSIPILLSTEFVGEDGAADITLNPIIDCPEPTSFLLFGTPLLASLSRRWYMQHRYRSPR